MTDSPYCVDEWCVVTTVKDIIFSGKKQVKYEKYFTTMQISGLGLLQMLHDPPSERHE
jgi:hypothetical protein